MVSVTIDGNHHEATCGAHLIEVINRIGTELAQVCYHPNSVLFRPVTRA